MNTLNKLLISVPLLVTVFLAGCSGGSGQETTSPPDNLTTDSGGDDVLVYAGPAPASDDVNSFKTNVWDHLSTEDRCGRCHSEDGGQEPLFMFRGDVNEAYNVMINTPDLVNVTSPVESGIIAQVAGGHQCWRPEPSVCADIIQGYLVNWLSAPSEEGEENTVNLVAPEEKVVGVSLKFPATAEAFESTVWPLLRGESGCSGCHSEDGSRMRQQPYFASANVETAYAAAQARINLTTVQDSRLVVRPRSEGHNCWADPSGGDACAYSGREMQSAIQSFIDLLDQPEGLDPALEQVASRAVNLVQDGVIASSGGRFETNVIALYEFKLGVGGTAADYSGVDPALDLNISGDVSWVGSWGLRFAGGTASGSTAASKKLNDRIKRTGEYSIEAWVIPANVTQDGPARIVSYAGGVDDRNFMLGQTLYDYDFLSRSSEIDQDDFLSTPGADEILQATLQHVVVNYDPVAGRYMYVNGELVATDERQGGNLNEWDDIFVLSLGGEVGGLESWNGTIRLLAIHDRILSEDQISTNFEAGVGQKFYLLFGVSHLVGMPESYVVFQVEVFDDYSYLFTSPFFISLDRTAEVPAGGIPIQGMRIGVNGVEAPVGQAYASLDTTVTADGYSPDVGFSLNSVGTVIASEQGQDIDEFFLTFDLIGDRTYARVEPDVPDPGLPVPAEAQSDIGTRVFGEINATLSSFTGVDRNSAAIATVYDSVVQQLPQVEDVNAFLPAHQAGVMQLAVAYCTEMVNDVGLRNSFFPDFNFSGSITTDNVNNLSIPLLARLGAHEIEVSEGNSAQLLTQPSITSFEGMQIDENAAGGPAVLVEPGSVVQDDAGNVLDPGIPLRETADGTVALVSDLILDVAPSGTNRAVIAGCTSVVGSAIMLMQ